MSWTCYKACVATGAISTRQFRMSPFKSDDSIGHLQLECSVQLFFLHIYVYIIFIASRKKEISADKYNAQRLSSICPEMATLHLDLFAIFCVGRSLVGGKKRER